MRIRQRVSLLLILSAVCGFAQRGGRGGQGEDGEALRFRFVGPAAGNRIAAVAGIPGDPNTYYAGAASGGIYKSTDGGQGWTPIFDSQPVAAIGALAVASSDPSIVWAGTGEAWAIRDSDMIGNGVYKSADAGKTWKNMGLEETGRIGRVIVHPKNPDIVFVCALGRTTGPQQERGVYRTIDGGAHWTRTLFVDENTGCSGLSLDARNNTLYAGTWQVEMHTYGMFSGGAGSGVHVSRDGGATWARVQGRGLPRSPLGKIDVAVAPNDSARVYALIQTADQGSLWRSDDAGETWRVVNWDRALIGRAGYYIRLAVSPTNENEVMVANSSFHVSLDGGETFRVQPWGGDNHDIWIDPTNADRFVVTDDAGMNITTVHGRGFNRVTLPIGQMYHVAVDNQVPYWIYTNMQDNRTMRGVSTGPEANPRGGGNVWEHNLGGCESGFTLPDINDPDIIWASCYADEVTVYDSKTKRTRSVSPWLHTLDSEPVGLKYRCHWTPPLATDPFDHNTIYYGCQVIFKTTNGGQSWSVISPDLSTQDPKRIVSSGGIVGDNLGQFYGEVVFAIAPSPLQKGLIWAGTNDGKVWYTKDGDKDGGGKWNDVSKGLPAWATISQIEPSHFDAGTAYVAADTHMMDNRDPMVFKTTDFGATWTPIQSNLPTGPLAYVRAVAEDPNRKGLLFAGTGNAFYYSLDEGAKWTPLQAGLPHAPVTWIVVQKNFRDVVLSTYGRGIYILDNITPLEQMAEKADDSAVRLFAPKQTYRFSRGGRATIDFTLKAAPRGPVTVEILDAKGAVIRTLRSPARAGLNRVSWDMHYEPPKLIALRTTPPENPHIWEEPRFRGADSRPITHWGIQPAQVGPMVAAGKYTVRVTVDGAASTQPLEILKDPTVTATDADIEASVKLQLRIRDDITLTSEMVNQVEWMRKQLEDVQKMLRPQPEPGAGGRGGFGGGGRGGQAEATEAAPATSAPKSELQRSVEAMDQKLQDVEYKLFSKALRTSDDKYYVEAYKVYLNLIWLNGEVGTGAGDVAGGADYKPTDTSVALLQDIEKDLDAARVQYKALMEKEVPAFNKMIAEKGIIPLVTAHP